MLRNPVMPDPAIELPVNVMNRTFLERVHHVGNCTRLEVALRIRAEDEILEQDRVERLDDGIPNLRVLRLGALRRDPAHLHVSRSDADWPEVEDRIAPGIPG